MDLGTQPPLCMRQTLVLERGIASRQLGDRNIYVKAVEPDSAMRQAASPHPLVEYLEGTAEATGLPDACVDLVTCFQCFHWFDPIESLKEFKRILKPSGRLALVWNHSDFSDPFTKSYFQIVSRVCFPNPIARFLLRTLKIAPSPSILIKYWYWFRWRLFNYLPDFKNFHRDRFSFKQELDLSGLLGLTMSMSFVPLSGSVSEQLVTELKELYERSRTSSGFVYLSYRTNVYLAER